ncbi:MAG TPA: hypothetical protein VFW25_14325 [Silvibacterium sp.]|nr:hypothetical protein [Silvibacterium sp.]
MKTWQNIGLITAVVLLIFSIRIYFIYRERHEPMALPAKVAERPLTQDEVVQTRKMYIDSLESAKALDGKTVWVQSGFSLDYYPYADHRVEFAHPSGVLPSAQPLVVQDIVTGKVPVGLATRVPKGDKQVFAVFRMPNSPGEYATAVGFVKGTDSTYYCDQIFYYDDPHQMYNFWGPKVWAAIDQHHPIPGMNELQTAMALGVIQQSESSDIGNRTVDYDAGGKKWSVTFQRDKAITIKRD